MNTPTPAENPLVFEEAFLEQAGLAMGRHWGYEMHDDRMLATVNLAGLLALADHAAKEHRWDVATLDETKAGIRAEWARLHGQTLPADAPLPPAWSLAKHNQLNHKGYAVPSEWAPANQALDAGGRQKLLAAVEAFLADRSPRRHPPQARLPGSDLPAGFDAGATGRACLAYCGPDSQACPGDPLRNRSPPQPGRLRLTNPLPSTTRIEEIKMNYTPKHPVAETPSQIAEYLVRFAAQVGDPLTLPRLQCLLLLLQGYYMAHNFHLGTGSALFIEPILRGQLHPEIASITHAYGHHVGPITLPPGPLPEIPAPVRGLTKALLREFGAISGLQLCERITNTSLWDVSGRTDDRLEHSNILAWFRIQKPLTLQPERTEVEVDFPIKHVEKFDHAQHQRELAQFLADEQAEKDRQAQRMLENQAKAWAEVEAQEAQKAREATARGPIARLAALFNGKAV